KIVYLISKYCFLIFKILEFQDKVSRIRPTFSNKSSLTTLPFSMASLIFSRISSKCFFSLFLNSS
ncbi:hypothetical protein X975_05396, partial [Stegodyphus mimosarum]